MDQRVVVYVVVLVLDQPAPVSSDVDGGPAGPRMG